MIKKIKDQALINKTIPELEYLTMGGPETLEKTYAISSGVTAIFVDGLGLNGSAAEAETYDLNYRWCTCIVDLVPSYIYGQIVRCQIVLFEQDVTFTRFMRADEHGAMVAYVNTEGATY